MFEPFAGKVHLTINADSPLDEVFVIDSGLRRVAQGLGKLSVSALEPGLYKVKFKTGDSIAEQSVLLNEPDVTIQGSKIALSSPVTSVESSAHPFLANAIANMGPVAKQWNGTGSGFFIYLNNSAATESGPPVAPHSLGITLLDANGLEWPVTSVDRNLNESIDCAPGQYCVRVNAGPIGTIQMSVPATPGFRTWVFIPIGEIGYGKSFPIADIRSAGILMSQVNNSPTPNDPMVYWTEQERLALSAGRAVAPVEKFRQLLNADWNDPMFLLLGAHLLLLDAACDLQLFRSLTFHLTELLPGHPDAQLLDLYARKSASVVPSRIDLAWPPMLSATWRLLQDPFMRDRVRIPNGSLAETASRNAWGNSVWLLWSLREQRTSILTA